MIESINQAAYLPTNDVAAAKERIKNFMSHSINLLSAIQTQTGKIIPPASINEAFEATKNKLETLETKLKSDLGDDNSKILSKKEITHLMHEIDGAEEQIAQELADFQITIASTIGSANLDGDQEIKDVQENISKLLHGGLKALVMRIMNFFGCYSQSISGLARAKTSMQEASKSEISPPPERQLSQMEREKLKEFEACKNARGALKHRKGVIVVADECRMQPLFSKKENLRAFRSFMAQQQSNKQRTAIEKTTHIEDNSFSTRAYTGTITPLNNAFDEHIRAEMDNKGGAPLQPITNFASIFDDKGISSNNRQEGHLINGWESSLVNRSSGKRIYQVLRHGIASKKFEKNPEARQKAARESVKELLMAAVMQRLADSPLTVEDKERGRIDLNFNSISLVTPDSLRPIKNRLANEKAMLRDQQKALAHFQENPLEFTIGGQTIKVELKIASFNFGVNAGAVKAGLGTRNQHTKNLKALGQLKTQYEASINRQENKESRTAIEAKKLFDAIEYLMKTSTAYLGANQYELGAKILLLSSMMDVNGSTKCAINCMSGKDRTGIMEGVAKTLAIMYDINQTIPTHEDLLHDAGVRAQFVRILKPMLLEMGGFEVVGYNTDVRGYKVGKEAMLGMSDKDFMKVLGLSKTSAS